MLYCLGTQLVKEAPSWDLSLHLHLSHAKEFHFVFHIRGSPSVAECILTAFLDKYKHLCLGFVTSRNTIPTCLPGLPPSVLVYTFSFLDGSLLLAPGGMPLCVPRLLMLLPLVGLHSFQSLLIKNMFIYQGPTQENFSVLHMLFALLILCGYRVPGCDD